MLTIRPAKITDFDDIWAMWKRVMDQKIYYPYDDTYTRKDIEAAWINEQNHCVVAEQNGTIVGAYILRPNQPGYGKHIANAAYMVHNDHRGSGIGKAMGLHSIDYARSLDYRAMQFNLVVSTNLAAIKAWEHAGFNIIGTIPEAFYHYQRGFVDAHIMYRKL